MFGTNRAPTMHQTQTLSPKGSKQDFTRPMSPRISNGCIPNVSEAMLHLVQTVDLSCNETNTISKWTETRFYLTHVTEEFHQVRPKRFLSLRYVRRKPFTYLESRLAPYPNEPKRASIWASSPWSTVWCVQNNFWGCVTFGTNRAPI
jgi:hypothetical protein